MNNQIKQLLSMLGATVSDDGTMFCLSDGVWHLTETLVEMVAGK